MTLFGIRISRDGKDAQLADAADLSFSSEYGARSVKETGTTSLTTVATGDWAETTITHNFGYKPQLDVFVDLVNGDAVTVQTGLDAGVGLGAYETLATGACATACAVWDAASTAYWAEEFRLKITDTTAVIGARFSCVCRKADGSSNTTYSAESYTFKYKLYMEEIDLP